MSNGRRDVGQLRVILSIGKVSRRSNCSGQLPAAILCPPFQEDEATEGEMWCGSLVGLSGLGEDVPAGVPKSFQKDVDATRTAHSGWRRLFADSWQPPGRHNLVAHRGFRGHSKSVLILSLFRIVLLIITVNINITDKPVFIFLAALRIPHVSLAFLACDDAPIQPEKRGDFSACSSPGRPEMSTSSFIENCRQTQSQPRIPYIHVQNPLAPH